MCPESRLSRTTVARSVPFPYGWLRSSRPASPIIPEIIPLCESTGASLNDMASPMTNKMGYFEFPSFSIMQSVPKRETLCVFLLTFPTFRAGRRFAVKYDTREVAKPMHLLLTLKNNSRRNSRSKTEYMIPYSSQESNSSSSILCDIDLSFSVQLNNLRDQHPSLTRL